MDGVEFKERLEERRPVIPVRLDRGVLVNLLVRDSEKGGRRDLTTVPCIHAWKPLPWRVTRFAEHPEEELLVRDLGPVPELDRCSLAPAGVRVWHERDNKVL